MKLVRKGRGGLESYWNSTINGIKDFGSWIVEGASYDPEGSLARSMAGLKPVTGESPVTIKRRDLKKKQQFAKNNWLLGYAPFAAIGGAATLPYLAPGTAAGNIIGTIAEATAGGELVNEASKAATGKAWDQNVYDAAAALTPKNWHAPQTLQELGLIAADFTNPGYFMGGPLIKAVTDIPIKFGYKNTSTPLSSGTKKMFSGVPINEQEELEIINAWREAAAKGDKEGAYKALLKWWKIKSPNDKALPLEPDIEVNPYFHSTDSPSFNLFDLSKTGLNWKESKRFGRPAAFFESAYVMDEGQWGDNALKYFINTENLYSDLDLSHSWDNHYIPEEVPTLSEAFGHAKQYFADLRRFNFDTPKIIKVEEPSQIFHEMVVFDPKLIKSAEPFTYDDAGNLIDITKRFNFKSPDTRYSFIPLTGVGTAAGIGAASANKE